MSGSKIHKSTKFIGARIRDGLKLTKTSQRQLAKAIDITEPSLSNIINGKQNPGLETVETIALFLELPPAYFLPPYPLGDTKSASSRLRASVIDDVMGLPADTLKALKVITDALRVRATKK